MIAKGDAFRIYDLSTSQKKGRRVRGGNSRGDDGRGTQEKSSSFERPGWRLEK